MIETCMENSIVEIQKKKKTIVLFCKNNVYTHAQNWNVAM